MKIAFIGLGDIGEPMASHLARDPFDLVVWNRTASKAQEFGRNHNARVAATPAEAVREAWVVITCLPSSVEVEAVLHGENGILDAMRKGAVLVDCTSGDPPTSRSIAAELGGRGVEFIDAPVSGGTTAAKAGTLTVMWGGDPVVFERVRPVIEAFGKKIVHAGPVGSGDALKAVNNALLAVHILSAAEGLAILAKAGVDPRVALDVINASKAVLIGGSISEQPGTGISPQLLQNKEFVVVQELFETETTQFADVVFPASSFAEVDGTYTNNTGFVQRVRKAIDPIHQTKPDWMITTMLAKEMGVDFGYNLSTTAVFKAIADGVPAYAGIRYPDLKDESRPVQVKHEIGGVSNNALEVLNKRVGSLPDNGEKTNATPKVGHKLHRLTTMTSKTAQFHLLAHGNPKPENLLVAPLQQFDLDGSPKQNLADAVGAGDRSNPGGR